MSDKPLVSIVVPVYNGSRTIRICLDSIYRGQDIAHEVIVINDGSTDNTASILAGYPCRVIWLETNKGRGYARNRGIEASRADLILFTDADCIVCDGWMGKAYRSFLRIQEKDSSIAAVGGRVLPLKGYFNKCDAYSCYGYNQDRLQRYADNFCTANLIAKKLDLIAVGMFDEKLPTFEDRDLGIRLQKSGHRLYYDPAFYIHHNHTRRGLLGFLGHEYQWGRQVGNLFEVRHPDYHRTPFTRYMANFYAYLLTIPIFAAAITCRVVLHNLWHDISVLAVAPFVFLSKLAYRIGALNFVRRKEWISYSER